MIIPTTCIHIEYLNVDEQAVYCSKCQQKLAFADDRRYPNSPPDTPIILYDHQPDGKKSNPRVIDATTGLLIVNVHA